MGWWQPALLAAVALTLSACDPGGRHETARAVSTPESPPVTTAAPPATRPLSPSYQQGDTPGPPGQQGDTPGPPGPQGDTPGPPGPQGDTPGPPGPQGDTPAPSPPLPPDPLTPGAESDAVRLLQERLLTLRYDPGTPDGRYRAGTTHAVMAFQKVAGLPRTGAATPETVAALNVARDPTPLLPTGGATRIEVDLPRQILLFYSEGVLTRILPVSTGNGKHYCAKGRCGVAVTPSGSYRIGRKVSGKRISHLGVLYNPLYFKGGYAIHGAPSVPAHPASHGCVRIPMHSSRWLLTTVRPGTPVYLIGGKYPATPFPPEA